MHYYTNTYMYIITKKLSLQHVSGSEAPHATGQHEILDGIGPKPGGAYHHMTKNVLPWTLRSKFENRNQVQKDV